MQAHDKLELLVRSAKQQAVTTTGSAAAQLLGAAGDLASQSNRLSQEVDQFLNGVRAA